MSANAESLNSLIVLPSQAMITRKPSKHLSLLEDRAENQNQCKEEKHMRLTVLFRRLEHISLQKSGGEGGSPVQSC